MVRSKIQVFRLVAMAVMFIGATLAYVAFGYTHFVHAQLPSITAKDYSIPYNGNRGPSPWGTTMDRSGNVWVALPGCDPSPMCDPSTPPGKIAIFKPGSLSFIAQYQLPAGYAQPLFLAFDKQGMLWFPMPMNNSLGMYNPTNQTYRQWPVPTPASGPWNVAIDSHGYIWFTEHYSNKIGRFNPNDHTFIEIPTPAANSQPYGIAVDGANNIWFTENNSQVALIGEYSAQGELLEYKIRTYYDSNLTPHLITVDTRGNIWWSEGFAGMIGKLKIYNAQPGTNNGVTEYTYHLHAGGTHTSGIVMDNAGNIWFDDSLQSIYGSFPEGGNGQFMIYKTPTAYSHPHDGLMIDSRNRIWFDEEFVNKLALAY